MKKIEKLAIVSGASRGIGKGIAEYLCENGYATAVGYHVNKNLAEELAQKYENAFAVEVDVTERASIISAIDKSRKHFNLPLSILINNAGIAQEKSFEEITDQDWDNMLITNLRSAFTFSQEALDDMKQKKWGRIINISSIGGQWGGFNQVHYAAAKAGLINLTKSLAKLYTGIGITCNTIAIGLIATDMSMKELKTEAGREKIRNIPAGRLGNIDEIAHTVGFLCSEKAGYITGQTINLNGGMYFG